MSDRILIRITEIKLQLDQEVTEELNQSQYYNSLHGKRTCYQRGCRGPLCKKANRDKYYKNNPKKVKTIQSQIIDEYLENKIKIHHQSREQNELVARALLLETNKTSELEQAS